MKITRSRSLPAAVEDTFAVIATQDHQEAKAAAQATESSATVTELEGGLLGVHIERVLPTKGMPGPVATVVGETLAITEQQTWRAPRADGARTADLEITVGGAPLTLLGTITLSPEGTGSTIAIDADLTCTVPLLGRKVEKAARPTIEDSFELEARMLRERLG